MKQLMDVSVCLSFVIFSHFCPLYWQVLQTNGVENCPQDICIWINQNASSLLLLRRLGHIKVKTSAHFHFWLLKNNSITHLVDRVKWQIKYSRHSHCTSSTCCRNKQSFCLPRYTLRMRWFFRAIEAEGTVLYAPLIPKQRWRLSWRSLHMQH